MHGRIKYSRSKYISHADTECIEISTSFNSDDENEKEATLAYLRAWVEDKLQIRETVAKLHSQKERLQNEIYSLEKEVEQAKARYQKVKEFLEKMNIPVVDDIPF